MGTALANYDAHDLGAANRAGFTCASINAKMVLEISAPVNPIDAGPVAGDTMLKHLADALQQAPSLIFCKGIGKGQGVQLCQVQSFIGIDISQPRQEGLVKQKRL